MPQSHQDELLGGFRRTPGEADDASEDPVAAEIEALLAQLVADLVD